ncbi:MAG: hypothetical protein KKF44_10540 [Nanoarchaeota archaeon]|nr:hypothetical protein [Nanoarchaeota archaeon]
MVKKDIEAIVKENAEKYSAIRDQINIFEHMGIESPNKAKMLAMAIESGGWLKYIDAKDIEVVTRDGFTEPIQYVKIKTNIWDIINKVNQKSLADLGISQTDLLTYNLEGLKMDTKISLLRDEISKIEKTYRILTNHNRNQLHFYFPIISGSKDAESSDVNIDEIIECFRNPDLVSHLTHGFSGSNEVFEIDNNLVDYILLGQKHHSQSKMSTKSDTHTRNHSTYLLSVGALGSEGNTEATTQGEGTGPHDHSRVLALTQRMLGNTLRGDYRYSLKEERLRDVVNFAHSMGGGALLRFALEFGQLYNKVKSPEIPYIDVDKKLWNITNVGINSSIKIYGKDELDPNIWTKGWQNLLGEYVNPLLKGLILKTESEILQKLYGALEKSIITRALKSYDRMTPAQRPIYLDNVLAGWKRTKAMASSYRGAKKHYFLPDEMETLEKTGTNNIVVSSTLDNMISNKILRELLAPYNGRGIDFYTLDAPDGHNLTIPQTFEQTMELGFGFERYALRQYRLDPTPTRG